MPRRSALSTFLCALAASVLRQPPAQVQASLVRFSSFAGNHSLVGASVPCSEREKLCLRYHRLYHAPSDRCYPLLEGPGDCLLVVDRAELQRTGHLRGTCLREPPCCLEPGASPSACRLSEYVWKFLCASRLQLAWSLDMFGRVECRCAKGRCRAAPAPEPVRQVAQPERPGRCAVPDFRVDALRVISTTRSLAAPSAPYRRCLEQGKVWFGRARACFALRQRGPCPAGRTLVLSRRLWETQGRVVSACEPLHLCPPRSRRLAFDGRCHAEARLRAALRPGEALRANRFGETFAAPRWRPRSLRERLDRLPRRCARAAFRFARVQVACDGADDCVPTDQEERAVFRG